ncbi:MAG: phosphoglycerate mutase [Acidovorax sp.]|nr:phosphoglycerate mutase [Acidovorax sp.]
MSDMHHLLIPYAASASEGAQQTLDSLTLPHLAALLARLTPDTTRTHWGEETSYSSPAEVALAKSLGLPVDDGRIPWAAWHRAQQGLSADSTAWAFITPCQWQVSTDHVTLGDPAQLALDEVASRALLDIVAPWFAEDGITLIYDQPTRWLAQSDLLDGLAAASLERVLHRDVRTWMPQGPDKKATRTLQRLHSEMQMLLYTHAFTDARVEQGLPTVNSFWVHGAGRLPSPPVATTGAPHVESSLQAPALREDWRAWAAAWQALDAGPLAQLRQQAEQGRPVRLTLCGERGVQSFHTAPRSLLQKVQSLFSPQRFKDVRSKL